MSVVIPATFYNVCKQSVRECGKTFDAAMLPCGRAVTDLRSFDERKPHGYFWAEVRGVE